MEHGTGVAITAAGMQSTILIATLLSTSNPRWITDS